MAEKACSWPRYLRFDLRRGWDGSASVPLLPQAIEQHADDDDGAKHDHLHVTVNTGKVHAIRQDRDEQRAEHGGADSAAATGEARSAHHGACDRLQRERTAEVRLART